MQFLLFISLHTSPILMNSFPHTSSGNVIYERMEKFNTSTLTQLSTYVSYNLEILDVRKTMKVTVSYYCITVAIQLINRHSLYYDVYRLSCT